MADYCTLSTLLTEDVECFVFDSIPSTNDYLLSLPLSEKTQLCIAYDQTKGKGQHGRQWLSKKDGSILFSIRRIFPTNTPLTGLSLVIGLAVVEALEKHGINKLTLKWPNDVYFQQQKLAGILIERTPQGNAQSVVIGVGINHHLPNLDYQMPWIDLKQILGFEPDRMILSKDLINTILKFCHLFAQQGFAAFHTKWHQYDYLLGKKVRFKDGKSLISGVCSGVDAQGLLLINVKGDTKRLNSSITLSLV